MRPVVLGVSWLSLGNTVGCHCLAQWMMMMKVIDILNSKSQRKHMPNTRSHRAPYLCKKTHEKGQRKKAVKTKSIKLPDHSQQSSVVACTTKQKGPWKNPKKWQLERKAHSQVIYSTVQ